MERRKGHRLADIRAVITLSAFGSNVSWRPVPRLRGQLANSTSTITPCAGIGRTTFRPKPAPSYVAGAGATKDQLEEFVTTKLWG